MFTYSHLNLLGMSTFSSAFFIKLCSGSLCFRDKANKQTHKLMHFN